MKKGIITGIAVCFMTAAMSMTAFAGQWQQDGTGWWYQNDDGSYLNNGWNWVDGKCYYFMPDGYCLKGTQTPDGYTVDESGAWVIDGVVQTQGTEAQADTQSQGSGQETVAFDNLTFTVPSGFTFDSSSDGSNYYSNGDETILIGLMSQELFSGEAAQFIDDYQEQVLDELMRSQVGNAGEKAVKQLPTGTWYCYTYQDNTIQGIPGSMRAYMRISQDRLQLIVFAGRISGMDTDGIMSSALR
ncbi:hypothetical protein [Clostridium sp. AM58-1XD]|uniref:hypothetical protein n=1 Tax=Clostridium sp. AM58-1XD TaxID=2292307 RepID=UPI000E498878|nr:hypothetical protein [Clostridium sp. AM58-1XD]RGY98366.1 hypothetical protein DXA13_11170 [Clostridium sp. AM58-1XD]